MPRLAEQGRVELEGLLCLSGVELFAREEPNDMGQPGELRMVSCGAAPSRITRFIVDELQHE